jgi:DHA1 family L-arabinose/isopropyl-beta-D-thiogalactopyranoside export protein-like MFS transporter
MNIGGVSESTTVVALFVYGISGILGTVIGSKFVDKHTSAALVIPLFIVTCSLASITMLAPHWNAFLVMAVFWGASTTAVILAFQTILLRYAKDAADVATALFSGIFNIGIGGGAFLGSHLSVAFGFSSLGYAGAGLVGICLLGCLILWITKGNAILGGQEKV